MLTVLHTESSAGWGGQENRILMESVGLKKLGARVIVLCQKDSILGDRASAKGIETRACRMKRNYDIQAIRYALDLIKTEGIDVVNTHSGRDSFLAGLAGRLSSEKPAVVRTRHLALPITSKFTYKFLAHRVVTISEFVRRHLICRGVSPEKIVTVHTGVDTEKFNPERTPGGLREELGLGRDTPLVGTVSILRRKKGHHILLEAVPGVLRKIPEAVFVFAGDGPQKENLLEMVRRLKLTDRVFMLGLRNDIPGILKSIDLFVLATFQEALGTSFLEAMAMEKPVIGTAVGGVPEVVTSGVNGYLVEPANPQALTGAIIRALKDKDKTEEMGREARKTVRARFTVEKMCEKMHALYSSVPGRKDR